MNVVDLDIHVGAVELTHACRREVKFVLAGQVWQRQPSHDFERRDVDPVCRNRVIGKRCAQCGLGFEAGS